MTRNRCTGRPVKGQTISNSEKFIITSVHNNGIPLKCVFFSLFTENSILSTENFQMFTDFYIEM